MALRTSKKGRMYHCSVHLDEAWERNPVDEEWKWRGGPFSPSAA